MIRDHGPGSSAGMPERLCWLRQVEPGGGGASCDNGMRVSVHERGVVMDEEPLRAETGVSANDPTAGQPVEISGADNQQGEAEDPELWANPPVAFPGGLVQRMVRVDLDVFDWFRSGGEDFEFRINEVLRKYIERQSN